MVLIIFSQMLALMILILVGYYVGRRNMMDSKTMKQLSGVINLILNPMLGISSAISAYGKADKTEWFALFAVAIVIFGFMILVSFLIAPFFDRRPGQKEMFQMMFVFVNVGFIGIPVVKGTFGAEYTVYVLAFMMAYNLYFYTIGMALMDGGFSLKAMKGMINPGTISSVVGMALFIFEIPLPSFLISAIDYMGSLVSPLAMLTVGVTLAASDLKAIFTNARIWLFTLVRMLIFPILCIPLVKLLPFGQTILCICIIEIGMPVGNLPLIIGTEKGIDCANCSAGIILTTLCSVVTLPILLMFFR